MTLVDLLVGHLSERIENISSHDGWLCVGGTAIDILHYHSSSSNAARRCNDGCHVSRPLCLLHARSWLRM